MDIFDYYFNKNIEDFLNINSSKIDYFSLCKNQLLNEINLLLVNEDENEFSAESENKNFDYFWSLITTTLLTSEKLCGKEKIDSFIDNKDFLESIEEIILKYGVNVSNYYCESFGNYFLDENNEVINPFYELELPDIENDIYNNKNYGCNDLIVENNKINYIKLVKRIRNALAHSNYEVLNNDYIKIYHYENNKLDLNIVINKLIVLTIIDEINEKVLKTYSEFFFQYKESCHPLWFNENISDEEIISHILSFKIINKDEIIKILKESKKTKEYHEKEQNSLLKKEIIFGLIYKKISPFFKMAQVLDLIIYEKYKNNEKLEEYFYHKYGLYNYYSEPISKAKEKKEKFKLLFLSLLNIIFLHNFNNKVDIKIVDFSYFNIDKNVLNGIIENIYNDINLIQEDIENKFVKKKDMLSEKNILSKRLDNNYRNNNYYNVVLPQKIDDSKQKLINLENSIHEKKVQIYKKLFEIIELKNQSFFDEGFSKMILRHIRNSLAHGNVYFVQEIDLNNLLNNDICFEDYSPNDKQLSFKTTINVKDLFNIINVEDYNKVLTKK
ncbi:MAG: hypothetical protein PHN42_01500 [Bacilli bacterium]|nr:hypothetical protein [Bacilli bacterium]